MTWFKSQTRREQIMILAMLALLCVFCLWQFAVKPVLDMKSDAVRDRAAAVRDYDIVRSGAPALNAQSAVSAGALAFDRSAIVTLAGEQGLPISRLQNESSGGLKVWFENVSSAQVYGFLSGLTGGYAASIEAVQMSRRSDGTISAQITLKAL